MSWANIPLVVEQNSQFSDRWLFFQEPVPPTGDPAGWTPYNFTGATLKMQVREKEDASSALIATFSTGTGEIVFTAATVSPGPATPGYNNGFTLTVSAANAASYARGVYFYDLIMTAAGVNTCIMNGTFEVVPTVTR
jgi:hypothetical protein